MIFGSYQEVGTVNRAVGVTDEVERVVIENSLGNVTVVAGRPGIVEVSARFRAQADDAKPVSEQDIEISSGDGTLRIRAAESATPYKKRKVHWEVRIPMTMDIRVRNGVGNVEATGLSSLHDLRTGVGNINVEAERVCGESRFRSGTGKVNVQAHRMEGSPGLLTGVGNLSLTTGSANFEFASLKCATGNIHIYLPATFDGHLDLRSALGSIKLGRDSGAVPVQSAFVGSRAQGALGQGPGEIEAKTGVGSITMNRA